MKKAKKPRGKKAKAENNEEAAGKKKKGGKKILLLIPIALVLVLAIAAVVILVVLPRFFDINLLGGLLGGEGGDSSSEQLEEKLPKKGLQAYEVGEDSIPSLDTILEEGEGELIMLRTPGKTFNDGSGVDDRYTYIYELTSYADVINRYLDLLMGSEYGFYITDETYLVQEERPELQESAGALVLARNATVPEGEEGGENYVFQLVIGWSESAANLAIRVSDAVGQISFPKKEPGATKQQEPSSVSMMMEQLREMSPALLGLPGNSMDNYTVFPVDGVGRVNEQDCRRFNIYDANNPGSIAGTYFFSVDQEHIYVLNPNDNSVQTIK